MIRDRSRIVLTVMMDTSIPRGNAYFGGRNKGVCGFIRGCSKELVNLNFYLHDARY